MPGDDDSHDDGERTRIGGLPPPIPKAPAAAPPAAPAAGDEGERTRIAPARPPGAPAVPVAPPAAAAPADDDPGERTQIVSAAPPRPAPAAPGTAAAAPDAGERTQIVGGAPPRPAPAAPSAPAAGEGGDRTQVLASPPPAATRVAPPAAPTPAAAAPPPVAAPAAPAPARPAPLADATVDPARGRSGAGDEERTVILTRSVQSTVRLERVKPPGAAEVVELDRPSLVFGRGHECDVKLRTPTASREHAKIFYQNGQWTIASLESKTIYIDGARHTGGEFRLVNGMRVRLGDDEFLVVDSAGGSAGAASSGGVWARILSFVRGLVGRRG